MKERNGNKTHQQRFQGRHVEPPPPPVETQRNEAPFGPDRDGEAGREADKERGPTPANDERK
jgi:hypothetical protein